MAGALDRRRYIEKIGLTKNRELGFSGVLTLFGERSTNQEQAGGFHCTLGRETRGGVFRFTEDVGHIVFAGDVREAL